MDGATMRAGIYVHIPFCVRKCAYCDFSSYPGLQSLFAPYVDAVRAEAEAAQEHWAAVGFDTAYLGGGTPTALPAALLAEVLDACYGRLALQPGSEVTVEANPGTVDADGLRALRTAGASRLSLGFQSLDDDELAVLGRMHSAAGAVEALALAREAGFDNVSVDLMFGLPGQRLADWRTTLARTLDLRPEHLSLYALTVEEETPLASGIACGALPAPDEDLAADMYEAAMEMLAEAGYAHYEISNWARRVPDEDASPLALPRLASRHNVKYWRNGPYLGLGAAAYSYDGEARYGNVRHPREYIRRIAAGESPIAERETPDEALRMGETMMLGLRLTAGVSHADFEARFGRSLEEAYGPVIEEFREAGLLERDAAGIRLTVRGRLLGNRVFGAFLP
ncbi:MAG: radical SAM family heme chaperone HemW [Chloroflexi bacterium]|nr:radical SAM family heme chaperone HemW [Chloroflexota bacterium]